MKAMLLAMAIGAAELIRQATPLVPADIRATVESLIHVIEQEYFDTAVIPAIASELRAGVTAGRYASVTAPDALAEALTTDLYAVTHDRHLAVAVTRPPSAAPPGGGPSRNERDKPTTAGFRKVEILPGNVGYLDLTMFLRPSEHRDALAGTMRTLQPAATLILDMRDNGGGSPDTVALLLSYLFDEPGLPLFEIIPRSGDTQAYATEPASAALARNGSRPLWVLTSRRTFSGGEGLAYLLQERGRAQIIGEPTAGAANPGRPYPVNDRYEVTVPNGHIRSAITHGNWEGTGVTPDVLVPADQALDLALQRARSR